MSEKTAVVLFNMGGPDSLKSVRPFLRNLFADPAIMGLPNPFRYILAELISRAREKEAKKNYALMGGKSPIVEQSQKQADALHDLLKKNVPEKNIKVFISMRYWEPCISAVKAEIRNWGADKIILLPLYPQFSTTTTGTFINAWEKAERAVEKVISYETNAQFIQAHVDNIVDTYQKYGAPENTRILMSAHGLPEKIILAGDPYQQQVEDSCAAIANKLPERLKDMQIAYQSRVGPLRWIGPSTREEIVRAGAQGKSVLVVPIAFVSEHIETLVELDIEYLAIAKSSGVKNYMRVPALSSHQGFISCLADLVLSKL